MNIKPNPIPGQLASRVARTGTWSRGAALLLASVAFLAFASAPVWAQVNRSLGTIPPGGTVTITFDVTIDNPFPANTGSVTNQGFISGTGFSPVLTDDPVTPGPNDPTVTAVTVPPQIACPGNLLVEGFGACPQVVNFGATVIAGFPAPVVTYQLGPTVITWPYIFPAGTNIVMVTATNGTAPDAVCYFTVTVVPGAPPELSIERSATNVVLSWPETYSCYELQHAPALRSPFSDTMWSLHPGPFTTIGGRIWVTNGITATNRFFRLTD